MKPYVFSRTRKICTVILSVILLLPVFSLAQNNTCTLAPTLVSSPTCVNTAGTLTAGATYTAIPGGTGCSASVMDDVWYTFTAKTTNPTITISGSTVPGTRVQVFSGSCAAMVSVACGNTTVSPTTVINTQYWIRIYSTSNGTGTFNICITDPVPANDLCTNAVVLTPTTTCSTNGNVYASTTSTTNINAPNCASGVTQDVWYRFVAQSTNPTITLSNLSGFTNPNIQLLSNNCGSNFTSYYCGTTSINADFLTPGTTYYIRVYSTGAVLTNAALFDICITDPVVAPSNDECAGAVNLSVSNACNNQWGNMAGATLSAIPLAPCAGTIAYDVWYKFTAVSTSANIALSSFGTNFTNQRIQLFSTTDSTCATLSSLLCSTSPLAYASLIVGHVYYVRVYSTTGPPPTGNARFNICITSSLLPVVRYGNTYVNITKKTTGGVVQPNDILEIRMTIHHTAGTSMSRLRFVDNIPTNTSMLTGPTDFIKIITNEGLPYKQYTRAAGDDAATYIASPLSGQFNIRMNLGFGTSNPGIPTNNTSTESVSASGTMINTNRPSLFGNALLFAIAYRVQVTGVVGDTITLNPAQFIYRDGATDVTLTATPYKILISDPMTLCTNSIGLNNDAAESGGTFGSGTTLNRGSDLATPIAGYSFLNDVNGAYNGLGDGRYAVVKNISPRSGTNRNARRQPASSCGTLPWEDPFNCNNRMHGGHWYIDGDHTGTNNAIGNIPPDKDDASGYMLMVNADYVSSDVYRQELEDLCPNTYYEFSAWFRNICPTCGVDSIGAQFTGSPTAPANGYPGVLPNLSFSLNGLDYYNTGEIDTLGWIKKGFVFRTGPSQTSAVFTIRNNSQGGGGNDWVMDDISIATCLPNMTYSPTINPTVCIGNPFELRDTVRSYFNNYGHHQWEYSSDGGSTWLTLGAVRDSVPQWNATLSVWEYVSIYTVPPAGTQTGNNGDLYRVLVATTSSNLSNPNCRVTDGISTIQLTVEDCGIPLKTDLLSFNGKLITDRANLSWTTSKEDEPVKFTIQRSDDGNNFTTIGTLESRNSMAALNSYSFIDPSPVTDKKYYRIILNNNSNRKVYSRTIMLNRSSTGFHLVNLVNPFSDKLEFDVAVPLKAKIDIQLTDLSGKILKRNSFVVNEGTSSLSIPHTDNLPGGLYILQIINKDEVITRKVVKKTN